MGSAICRRSALPVSTPTGPGATQTRILSCGKSGSKAARIGSIVSGNKPLSSEQHLMVRAICGDGLGKRQRIAPDTAKSAPGLRALEI